MKASKRHYKSNLIQFKQEGSVVYSVGLIFGRKKSKLFITDALKACNKCIRVQRDMHRAVTELSDISIEGFISTFLHV